MPRAPKSFLRHRTVQAISPSLLGAEVAKLVDAGWRPIGEPTLAVPVEPTHPPYWVQSLYLAADAIPHDSVTATDVEPMPPSKTDRVPRARDDP